MPTAQEAYLQNLQYRAVNAPGTITAEEAPYAQQYTSSLDAAKEQAKMQVAFSQPRNDTQIQQSEAFKQITAEYAASRNRVVTSGGVSYQGEVTPSNPYPAGTAAAIAWEVGRTGGAVESGGAFGRMGVAEKAIAEGAKPSEVYVATDTYIQRPSYQQEMLTTKEGQTFVNQAWSGVPIRQNISVSELLAAPSTPIVSGISTIATPSRIPTESLFLGETAGSTLSELYVPYGRYAQTKLENVKTAIDPLTGENAIYQQDTRGRWGLIGGGGRGALQSGRFSTEALTPSVTTQLGAGTYTLPKGEGLSRLGAEAYGGKVMALDSRVLAPGTQMARYAGETNLANLAAQAPAGKAEAPGAAIPWSVSEGAPAIQLMSEKGLSGVAILYGAGEGRIVSTESQFKRGEPAMVLSSFPLPFKSISGGVGLRQVGDQQTTGAEYTTKVVPFGEYAKSLAMEYGFAKGIESIPVVVATPINPRGTAAFLKSIYEDVSQAGTRQGVLKIIQETQTGAGKTEQAYIFKQGEQLPTSVVISGASRAVNPTQEALRVFSESGSKPVDIYHTHPQASLFDNRLLNSITEGTPIAPGGFGKSAPSTSDIEYSQSYKWMLGNVGVIAKEAVISFPAKEVTVVPEKPISLIGLDVLIYSYDESIVETIFTPKQQLQQEVEYTAKLYRESGVPITIESGGSATPSRVSTESQFKGMGPTVPYGAQQVKTGIGVLATGPVVTERAVGTRPLPEPFISFVGTTEKEQQRKYDVSVFGGYSGGLIGYALFGTKSPEVVKGFMGSVVDEITGIVGLRPAETIFKTTEGKKTYEYGEYTKAGESLGTSFRGSLGYTRPQLEAYGTILEQKRGIETIPEKIVYGVGYTLTTRPEKFVSAVGAGFTIAGLGEIATTVSKVPAIATRVGAFEAAHPTFAATMSAAYRYGVPTGLLGVTYYSASEGLTATPERTTINIGKGTPELAGFLYGGYGGYQGVRAADAGYIGFKNIEKRIAFTEEALKSVNIELLPPEAARPIISKSPIREVSAFEPGTLQTVYSIRQRPIGTPGYAEVVTTDPFAQLSARGLDRPSLREEVTSSEFYSRYQSSIYGQPLSARTTLLREKQLQDIFGSSLEPSPTGVMPMDILPGVGKIGELRVMESDIMAQNVAAIVAGRKPAEIGVSTERGVEYGGAPMSQQMLETLVNPALTPARRATGATSIESTITETAARARVAPAIQYATSQKILPSKLSFEYPTTMKGIDIVNVYESVIQSEKRAYVQQTPKTLQKMIQPELTPFDYGPTRKTYEDYIAQRVVSQVPSTKPSTVVTPVVIPSIKPTTRVIPTITPTTASTQRTVVTPSAIPKTIPSVSSITIPTTSITPTTRITPMVTQPPQYTPRTEAITRVVGTPTPSVPSYPTKPITIAPPEYTPRSYKITPPTTPPYSPTPTTTPPIKSPPVPIIPGIPSLPSASSIAGVTPSIRKRRAAFQETFMLGLDISMTGRRKVRAKSYKSPKKKAAKPRKKR